MWWMFVLCRCLTDTARWPVGGLNTGIIPRQMTQIQTSGMLVKKKKKKVPHEYVNSTDGTQRPAWRGVWAEVHVFIICGDPLILRHCVKNPWKWDCVPVRRWLRCVSCLHVLCLSPGTGSVTVQWVGREEDKRFSCTYCLLFVHCSVFTFHWYVNVFILYIQEQK